MVHEIRSASYTLTHSISHIALDRYLIHSHPFFEVHYTISGDVRFIYAGMEYTLEPHTLILIAPNVYHGIHILNESPYERFAIHFTEETLPLERRDMLMRCLPDENDIRTGSDTAPFVILKAEALGLVPLLSSIDRLCDMPEESKKQLVPVLLEALLYQLTVYRGGLITAQNVRAHYSDHQEINAILTFIHRHLTEKLTLDELSRHMHLSKSKLCSLFQRRMGTTVMEYITRKRLNYAQQLLINGFSAAQAGAAAGFGDYTGFYRAYLKQMGHSPAEDKRMHVSLNESLENPLSFAPSPKVRGDDDLWLLHKEVNRVSPVDRCDAHPDVQN